MTTPVTFAGWPKGVDNIHADNEIIPEALRRAVNADVLDSGKLRRRKGFTLSSAQAGAHSLWSDGVSAYYVRNNELRRFLPNGSYTALGTVAAGVNHVAYVKAHNTTYLTCAAARASVKNNTLGVWGIEVPASPPVMAVSNGTLPPGTYYSAVTYLTADGRESGASVLSSITLTVDGGIVTTALPIPLDASIAKKRLYLSTADGEVLYMAASVGVNDQFVTASTTPAGAELKTAYLRPPPFGTALAHCLGRIFIVDAADPSIVWFTEALDYDHVNIRKGYYQFGAPVSVIAAVADGLYVCADQTYFIAGAGSLEASQRVVFEFGAVAGSAASIPNSADVIWMSEQGAVLGKDGGAAEILSKISMSPGGMAEGAGMVREKDGIRQYVVVGSNTDTSALQAGSYAEAEIVRRSV